MNSILSAVVAATLALAAIEADAQATAGERQVSLTIESASLSTALDKWAQQSGFQIFVQDWEATKNLTAPSLKGTFSAQAALEQLLQGTPLTYVWLNEKAVSIRRKSPQTVPATLQRTGLEGSSIPVAKFSGDDAGGAGTTYSRAESDVEGGGETSSRVERLGEIIVTGTYIRGEKPIGSPLNVYSRDEMDASGAATIEQFARRITENFSSMDMTANNNSTATAFANTDAGGAAVFGGAAFDLHGLGPTATLTLLNGNRMASSGFNGAITDISQVPLSAVERIEVLADGASAIYGADAISGVVNIVTRPDFAGAETSVRYGGASDGGASQLAASQLLGTAWDSGNVLLTYEYNEQDELDASERDYIPDQGGRDTLIPENRANSALLTAAQSLGSDFKLSGNVMYSDRETLSHAHSENTASIADEAQLSNAKQSGASLRLERLIGRDWSVALAGNYSQVRQDRDLRSSNTINGASTSRQSADADLTGGDLLASGTVAQLPAGAVKVAFGSSLREEELENSSATTRGTVTTSTGLSDLSRRVKSAYAELRVPVFGQPGSAQRMDLSGAVRYDDYSDVGSTTNYKFGVGWNVADGVHLRATYGTSFRAPLLTELGATTTYVGVPIPDPASPSGVTRTIVITGGNPALEPEESESLTAGFDIRPAAIPHLSIGVTYFHIDFHDRIATPPISGNPLTNPVAAPFVVFNPPLADVQAVFANPAFLNFCCTGPQDIGAIFDPRQTNLAATKQSGVDLRAAYDVPTTIGQVAFTLAAERLLHNDFQILESLPSIELLNRFARPPKWRGRGGVAWNRAGFSASLSLSYVNSYVNGLGASPTNPGSQQRIDSWTMADLFFGYTAPTDVSLGAFRGLSFGLSINNLTDEEPPFVEIPAQILLPGQKVLPFDAANATALGRYVSLQVTKRW